MTTLIFSKHTNESCTNIDCSQNAKSPLIAEDLPFASGTKTLGENPIVIVGISHDHLDHINFRTLRKLPEGTLYYVPHGLESKFPSRYTNVIGMDWYTQDTIGDLTIHFLPANHGSGIFSHEQDHTLWGGWLFEWIVFRLKSTISLSKIF